MTRPGLELTARDETLLVLVGLCRYMSLAQVAVALFPSEERCRKRVKQLSRAGLVRLTLRSSRASRLVSLTPKALTWLRTRVGPGLAPRLRLAGTVNEVGIDHHLGLVATRLYVSALAESGCWSKPGVARTQDCAPHAAQGVPPSVAQSDVLRHRLLGAVLKRWWSAGEPELAAQGFAALRLRPDAVCLLGSPEHDDGDLRIAVEVDTHATEELAVIEAKLKRYATALAEQLIDELWFVVDAGHVRSASIAALIVALGLADTSRVLLLNDHVSRRPAAGPPDVVASLLSAARQGRPHLTSFPQAHPQGSPSQSATGEPHLAWARDPEAERGSGA